MFQQYFPELKTCESVFEPIVATIKKPWHREMTTEQRKTVITKVATTLYPRLLVYKEVRQTVREVIDILKKTEHGIFEHTFDKSEYQFLLSEHMFRLYKHQELIEMEREEARYDHNGNALKEDGNISEDDDFALDFSESEEYEWEQAWLVELNKLGV